MQAIIDELIMKLTEFRDATTDLDTVKTQHADLTNQVDALKEALDSTKSDLVSAQSGLSVHQTQNLKKYQEDIFTRTKELEALNVAVREARTRLETINVEIDSASKRHQQIEDSLANLRKQHFG